MCYRHFSSVWLEGAVAFDRVEWSEIPMCTVLTYIICVVGEAVLQAIRPFAIVRLQCLLTRSSVCNFACLLRLMSSLEFCSHVI
jgi:hypothetical protein